MTEQTKNYTDEQVDMMVAVYTETPTRETVEALSAEMGKTTRSIIAKLSREGVYVAQPKVSKTGAPVVSKAELVAKIQDALGRELPSLVKATKGDLVAMVEAVCG